MSSHFILTKQVTMDDTTIVILCPELESEPWLIRCRKYPNRWMNHKRKEKWADTAQLEQVALDLRTQRVTGRKKYLFCIWAGYTHYEAARIAKLARTAKLKE